MLLRLGLALAVLIAIYPVGAQAQSASTRYFAETGFSVSDDAGVRFLSELERLGGVAVVGYPASGRFVWDGFTVQVFQRAVFQWRPEVGRAYFVNVFDRLHTLGKDDWLHAVRQTPRHLGGMPETVLEARPRIRAAYQALPLELRGYPTSDIVDMGNHYALRAQRVVFQEWKEDVPWARRGDVTVALGGDIAKEAGAIPMPTTTGKKIVGYYAPWDAASFRSLEQNADVLDYVAAQWVTIDACGGIGSRDDHTLKRLARERGIGVLPSLVTFSGWLNGRVLNDPAASARAIRGITEYVVTEDYPGFDLDLEGVEPHDRAAYSRFVRQLAEALHSRGRLLTLAVPPKPRDVITGWSGAYDYAAIGQHADLITLMTYEYHGVWSGPGPVAPHGPVGEAVAYAVRTIPAHKVLMGLGVYGYDWNVTSGGAMALGYPEASWLAERYRVPIALDPVTRSATFRYRAPTADPEPPSQSAQRPPRGHDIRVRTAPLCGIQPPPSGPPPTPRPRPAPDAVQEHVVWIEDGPSVAARLVHTDAYRTGGVAFWRLGQEDPRTWAAFREWRRQ